MTTKTIDEFYADLLAAKQAESNLNVLNSTSKAAIWRLILYCFAVGAWILQNLVIAHLEETRQIIADTKPGVVRQYRQMALDFQYGYALVPEQIYYDNTGLSDTDIESSKVVKYCAAQGVSKGVRLKVAGLDSSGELAPLSALQEQALIQYFERVKDTGVKIFITNKEADLFKGVLTIYYDPLVLDSQGKRLDGTDDTPVQKAVASFLKNLPFNGLFTVVRFVDSLQLVPGVVIPHPTYLAAKYGTLNWLPFDVSYLPSAGYIRIGELTLNFLPNEPV